MASPRVRKPVFSGSFYSDDPKRLKADVAEFIEAAAEELDASRLKCDLRGLICPHAGYVYSGPVAGLSYAALAAWWRAGRSRLKVFLLGVSHQSLVEGVAVSTAEYWQTPLGDVRVSKIASEIVGGEDFFGKDDEAHNGEHSLEVQLPFLQCVLGENFEIVPLLMSDVETGDIATRLGKYLDEDSLVIASTDLSHYLSYDQAVKVDRNTIGLIEALDIGGLREHGDACGIEPVMILVSLAVENGWNVQVAGYKNSGDTTGDKSAVVGYVSALFCAGD